MYKFLYTIITDPLGLFDNALVEWIVLLIVGEIVHEIAWYVSPGGTFGSLIYWTTKLAAFLLIWIVLRILIVIVEFIITNWIWFVFGVAVIGVMAGVIAFVRHKKGGVKKCEK